MSEQPEIKVILYSNANLTGTCVPVTVDIADLGTFKERAQSAIVIHGQWELKNDSGKKYALNETVGRYADLGTFNQQAISITRV